MQIVCGNNVRCCMKQYLRYLVIGMGALGTWGYQHRESTKKVIIVDKNSLINLR